MGLFGKSLEEKVEKALQTIRSQFPGSQIDARVSDEVVTLTGRTTDINTKGQIMAAFNSAVEAKNTINQIALDTPAAHAAGTQFSSVPHAAPLGTTSASEHRMHDVASGDTLSAIAKRYYGDASQYHRIFEANRDQLSDPDKIQAGQRLKIPT